MSAIIDLMAGENVDPKSAKNKAPIEADEISLEDIDNFLEDEEPEFSKQMSDMEADEELKAAKVEGSAVDETTLLAQDAQEAKSLAFYEKHPKLYKALYPLRFIREKLSQVVLKLKNKMALLAENFWVFLRVGVPERTKYLLSLAKGLLQVLGSKVTTFKNLPGKKKLLYLGYVVFLGLVVGLIKLNLKGVWLPSIHNELVTSMSEVADQVYTFDKSQKLQHFYRAFPQPEHIVLLDKIVINLRREAPGENPMVLFRLFLNLDSQETAIEVKDREKELLDRIGRSVEELTYDEVKGGRGKERLKNLAKAEINNALNQGRAMKVFFDMIMIKPP